LKRAPDPLQRGIRMRHILEEEERRKMEPDLVPSTERSAGLKGDPLELLRAGQSGHASFLYLCVIV
jgi:hypothetical protein